MWVRFIVQKKNSFFPLMLKESDAVASWIFTAVAKMSVVLYLLPTEAETPTAVTLGAL